MGLFGPSKREQELQAEIDRLRAQLPPQGLEIVDLQRQLTELREEKAQAQTELEAEQKKVRQERDKLRQLEYQHRNLQHDIVNLEKEIAIQDYGLYRPTFIFASSDLYKDRLKAVRERQKQAIKNGSACTGDMTWSVNGDHKKGQKMVSDMQKLLMRAFNVECDDIVGNVKISNFEKSKERINKIAAQISKLGNIMEIAVTTMYVNLKLEELCLALDFDQKKQAEKEAIKEARAREREEARVQKEIEEERKRLQKEQAHYQNALSHVMDQLRRDPNNEDLIAKRQELEDHLSDIEADITNVDYREANKRAGYVYIISNIGAFGENMFKIGMTRRLDPMERIDELSSASVPFNFDVHALIFTDDAPGLEAALHRAFESRKVNKINPRREFFRVSLDEIKAEVRRNFDKTVEWTDIAEADQYRQSLLLGGSSTVQGSNTRPTATTAAAAAPPNQHAPKSVSAPSQQVPRSTAPSPAQTTSQPNPIDKIRQLLKSYRTQEEDTPGFIRIHIYNSSNQKLGIVKITKPDQILTFKVPGNPAVTELQSPDDITKFLT